MKTLYLLLFSLVMTSQFDNNLEANTRLATEQQFHDLFITAGYSTAFGAALGAAFLGLSNNPGSRLKYVAMGASLGFITGSVFGTYLVFSPIFISQEEQAKEQLLQNQSSYPHTRKSLSIRPVWNTTKSKVSSINANWVLARF